MTQAIAALSGGLRLRPGAAVPDSLRHTRSDDLVARLGQGQPAQAWPGRVASVFNLCGHAQHLCAALAVQAAAPGLMAPPSGVAEALRRETAREHVRRIALDWPRLLGGPDALAARALASLRACPLLLPANGIDPWGAMSGWLRRELLHVSPTVWWWIWQTYGPNGLDQWSRRHGGWLPRLLRAARAWDASDGPEPAAALHVPVDGGVFTDQPAGRHTGSWTRQTAPVLHTPLTPWALLCSRLAELVSLSLGSATTEGRAPLAWGAVATGPGCGLAWVEMARGLLLHEVAVDGASGRLIACQLRSPTDWNFHPEGPVARQLAELDGGEDPARLVRRVRLLVAAFDPCLPFEIECPQVARLEPCHA